MVFWVGFYWFGDNSMVFFLFLFSLSLKINVEIIIVN